MTPRIAAVTALYVCLMLGCDGPPDDNDGVHPGGADADGDGYRSDVDCDDQDAFTNPDGTEVVCDGKDNDCDETTLDGLVETLQEMVDLAQPGDTITLCETGYHYPTVVNKPLTIQGAGRDRTLLESTVTALMIQETEQVTVADLTVRGSLEAIIVNDAEDVVLQSVTLEGSERSGLFCAGGSVVVTDLEASGHLGVAIHGAGCDLTVSGAIITDSASGILVEGAGSVDGGARITGVVMDGVTDEGIFVFHADAEVTSNTIIADPEASDSIGIAVEFDDGVFVVEGNTIEGVDGHSIHIQAGDPEPQGGTATVRNNTVTDGVGYGILVNNLDQATVSGNHVAGLRWGGDQQNPGSYGDGYGLGLRDIDDLTLEGNVVEDVDVIGLYVLRSSFTSTDDELSQTHLWGGRGQANHRPRAVVQERDGTVTRLSVHD